MFGADSCHTICEGTAENVDDGVFVVSEAILLRPAEFGKYCLGTMKKSGNDGI